MGFDVTHSCSQVMTSDPLNSKQNLRLSFKIRIRWIKKLRTLVQGSQPSLASPPKSVARVGRFLILALSDIGFCSGTQRRMKKTVHNQQAATGEDKKLKAAIKKYGKFVSEPYQLS